MTIVDGLGLIVAAVVTVSCVRHILSGQLKRDYAVFRTLRGGKWLAAIPLSWLVLAIVVFVGGGLVTLNPSVLGWSWLRLLSSPGKPQEGTNLIASGLQIPGFAWVFLALLMINVPRLALNEEYAFRKGFKDCRSITLQSLKFGLVHCLVGVPLGFGLALGLAGAWFAFLYLKGGTRLSAAYHSIHNWSLLLLAGLWIAYYGV